MATLFSVPAMFVMFREVIETAVIISLVLSILSKIGAPPDLKKQVWWGVGLGLVVSLATGVAFAAVFYTLKDEIFEGKGENIFQGVMMLLAAILVTTLAITFLKVLTWELKLEKHVLQVVKQALTGTRRYALFSFGFLAVIREGIECVLFVTGVGGDNWKGIPLAAFVGGTLGIAVGYLVAFSLRKISVRWLSIMLLTALLLAIAAGMVAHAVNAFQEAELFGKYEEEDVAPFHNRPLWNICGCCDHEDGFFAVVRAIVWYSCKPTFLEIICYISYWVLIVGILLYKHFNGGVLDDLSLVEAEKVKNMVGESEMDKDAHRPPPLTLQPSTVRV